MSCNWRGGTQPLPMRQEGARNMHSPTWLSSDSSVPAGSYWQLKGKGNPVNTAVEFTLSEAQRRAKCTWMEKILRGREETNRTKC